MPMTNDTDPRVSLTGMWCWCILLIGLVIGLAVPRAMCPTCSGGPPGAWDPTGMDKPLGADMLSMTRTLARPLVIILPFTAEMIESWSMYRDVQAFPLRVQIVRDGTDARRDGGVR